MAVLSFPEAFRLLAEYERRRAEQMRKWTKDYVAYCEAHPEPVKTFKFDIKSK
jgi:hypothetical protein